MFLGPAFLRENFVKLFADPIETKNVVLKLPHANEAALIAAFFNADDYALRKRWSWDTEEDYTEGYVTSTLLNYLGEMGAAANSVTLNIYDANYSEQMGHLEFFAHGQKQRPFASFYLLPPHYKSELAREVHKAVLERATAAGLMYAPQPLNPNILRAQFAKAAGGSLTTARLCIRPYEPADNEKLIKHVSGVEDQQGLSYEDRQIRDIEAGHLSAGIFTLSNQELVGGLTFWQIEDNQSRMAYEITPLCRGQGFASEAHKACLAWTDGFLPIPITRAEFVIGNQASEAVLKKSGFHAMGEVECDAPGLEGVKMIRMERPRP